MVMEYNSKRKPLLVLLVLSCLLLPLVSSVPLSRSVSLRNHQTLAPALDAPVQVMVMEYNSKKKLLLVLLVLSLLLPLVFSVPLSRSVSLRNHQTSASALDAPVQDVVAAEERHLGEVAARMVIEVNDYPGSGANNRHDPKSPGRA